MDLAEAELESNPDERDTGRDPDVLIEYAAQNSINSEVPLFSSLNSYKSLTRGHVPRGGAHVGTAAILLSEPISPPKQFDSSYNSYSGSGLRVQPHSIHSMLTRGPLQPHQTPGHTSVRDETY